MFSFRKSNLDKIKSFIMNLKDGEIEKSDKEKLVKMIRPTVGVQTIASDDKNLKVGKSKIGGRPDLPKDFLWPKVDDQSMLFCAQYNLSELTKFDKENILPNKGFFYIFIALIDESHGFSESEKGFKFIYSESESLVRTDFPKDIPENQIFKTASINYLEYYTIPDNENYKLDDLVSKYPNLGCDFHEPITEFIALELYPNFEMFDNFHQILGHDKSIQSSVVYDFAAKDLGIIDSPEYEKRWNEILELSKTYELLLQLDCFDSNTDLSKYGGSAVFYIGLSKTDLEKKNFNNIKLAIQMS